MRIMVLNDGETYTDVGGCHLIEVSDDLDPDNLEDQLDSFMRSGQDAMGTFRIVCRFHSDGTPIPYADE